METGMQSTEAEGGALARRRALAGVEGAPAYKGRPGRVVDLALPADLTNKGYRLRRDDTGLWWERGRGRNVIKGQRQTLEDLDSVAYDAYADLEARGGPAPSRSKKAAAEATEPADMVDGAAEPAEAPAELATEPTEAPAEPAAWHGVPDALALAEAGDPEYPADDDSEEIDAEELDARIRVAVEREEEEAERQLPRELYKAGYRLKLSVDASDLPWGFTYGSGKNMFTFLDYSTPGEAISGAVADYWARTGIDVLETPEQRAAGAAIEEYAPWEAAAADPDGPAQSDDQADLRANMTPAMVDGEIAQSRQPDAEPAAPAPAAGPTLAHIEIGKLRLEWEAQSRLSVSDDTIAAYADDFARYGGWGQFPPVKAVYDGEGHYWIYDGYQRVTAYRRWAPNGAGDKIPVELTPGGFRLAVLLSTGVNADHGLRRSRADIQSAVTKLLKDPEWRQWSNAEIARYAKVDPKTVGNIRGKLEHNREIPDSVTRRTADGHTVTVNKKRPEPAPAPVPTEPVYDPFADKRIRVEVDDPELAGLDVYLEALPFGPDNFTYRGVWPVTAVTNQIGPSRDSKDVAMLDIKMGLKLSSQPVIDFAAYADIKAAGFVMQTRQYEGSRQCRWWYPAAGEFGVWVHTMVKACDLAAWWYRQNRGKLPAPGAAAEATVEATEPAELAPLPTLPAALDLAGYRLEWRGNPPGSAVRFIWQSADNYADFWAGRDLGTVEAAAAAAAEDYWVRFGAPATEAPAEDDTGIMQMHDPDPEPAEAPAAPAPDTMIGGPAIERVEIAPARLPDNPTLAQRIETGIVLRDMFRATLQSLAAYEKLTGKFAHAAPIRRGIEPALEAVNVFLGAVGATE